MKLKVHLQVFENRQLIKKRYLLSFGLRLSAIVALLVVVGCRQPSVVQTDDGELVLGEFQETSSMQRGVSIGARTLILESETGGVTITGSKTDEVSLLFTITARGDSREAALAQIDALLLEESGDETTYRYNVVPKRAELTSINIEGKIPRNTSLKLVLRNGDVTLTNLDGTIEARQENGSIVYLGGSETVTLVTFNGDIFADFYSLRSGSRINLSAANGDLSLGAPQNANVSIDARTRAGSIKVHDLLFSDRKLNRKGAGAVFTGKLGNGSATAFLKTSNGSVSFNGVSLTAAPDDEEDTMMKPYPVPPMDSTTVTDSLQSTMPSDSMVLPAAANTVPPVASGADSLSTH